VARLRAPSGLLWRASASRNRELATLPIGGAARRRVAAQRRNVGATLSPHGSSDRKIAGKADLEALFEWPLTRANQIRSQQQRQRGWKLYSFHAPEVKCIGKGKASAPYEFGVKASIATTNARAPAASSCCTPKRCRATPMMATRWAS
jgi:hypothetical protein